MTAPTGLVARATDSKIQALLRPASIAVVGASDKRAGGRIILALQRSGYRGSIYPVNPNRETVLGLKCYPSLESLPETADCAYLATPAATIPGLVDELGATQVPAAVVYASGFYETGEAGAELERDVVERALRHKIALCGPSSLGFINSLDSVAPFVGAEGTDRPGPIGIISQSAGFLDAVRSSGSEFRAGTMIASGAEAVLTAGDYLAYLARDERLSCFGLILEAVKNADALRRSMIEARAAGKVVVVLKTGKTEGGRLAALSHTGSLAGDPEVWAAFFRRYGALQVEDLDEFLETLTLAASSEGQYRGVALVGTSGGKAGLFADLAEQINLELVNLTAETRDQLTRTLGEGYLGGNPVDTGMGGVLSDPSKVKQTLRTVADDEGVGLVAIYGDLPVDPDAHSALFDYCKIPFAAASEVATESGKQVVFINTRIGRITHANRERLGFDDVPILNGAEMGLRALSNLINWHRNDEPLQAVQENHGHASHIGVPHPASRPARSHDDVSRAAEPTLLGVRQTIELLDSYGVHQTEQATVQTIGEAESFAANTGYPVVMKLMSPSMSHKTDAGWVRLGIRDHTSLKTNLSELSGLQRNMDGATDSTILIQKMLEGGTEVLVGLKKVPELGHLMALGSGGVLVELIGDVNYELLPVTRRSAQRMLENTKVGKMLAGVRGRPGGDIDSLLDVVEAMSRLGLDLGPSLAELDINPLIVMPEARGTYAVDARVVLLGKSESEADD